MSAPAPEWMRRFGDLGPDEGHTCRESADPRKAGSCSCGRALAIGDLSECSVDCASQEAYQASDDKRGNYEEYVDRDIALERYLTGLAARAAGFVTIGDDGRVEGDTGGLDDFADARAWSGGVRASIDAVREAREELADARHYLVWGIQQVHDAYREGDSAAGATYDRLMRALQAVVEAWHALAGSTRAAG